MGGRAFRLDSALDSLNEGNSPEAIREDFPLLKRAWICGAIALYWITRRRWIG
jgi:uncharacterized protein (DUF433 family)